MACARQAPTALLLVPLCQCRVTHPWTLNPAAAKYYRPIRLAVGFSKRSATPASYQMQSLMTILIAYRIDMKEETIKHFWILQLLLEKGKNAPFDTKSPVKNFHGWAKKGWPSHRGPPPKYATDIAQLSMCCWIISPFNDFCCFRRVSHCMSPLTRLYKLMFCTFIFAVLLQ